MFNNKEIKRLKAIIKRQDALINLQTDELSNLQKRGYIFEAEQLTPSDITILRNHHEALEVIEKYFKSKADDNADKLLHNQEAPESKRLQMSMAVRIYDDLVLQMKMARKRAERT